MDGTLIALFLIATFFGGLTGFAAGLGVSGGVVAHYHADADCGADRYLRRGQSKLRNLESASRTAVTADRAVSVPPSAFRSARIC